MISAISREQVTRLVWKQMLRLLPGLVAGLIVALAFSPALAQPRVPLDQYRTLTQRDQVVVTGVVSEDNRGVFGSSIIPLPDWEMWEGQMP